jgi:hypothetical protein
MAENKTKTTDANVEEFILKVDNDIRREDSFRLVELFKSISGFEPKMYGPTIVGFGNYHYKDPSGHEGDAPLAAFSPRKDFIVFYFDSFEEKDGLLEKLGKHRSSKACVYVKKLADINLSVLQEITRKSIKQTQLKYPDK